MNRMLVASMNVSLILIVSIYSAHVSAAESTVQTSVQTFFSFPKVSQVKISPDGKHVSMVVADDTGEDRKELMIYDVDSKKYLPVFRTISDEVINRYWWANDTRLLVNTASQTGSLDRPVNRGDLYAINDDGSGNLQLMGPSFVGTYGTSAVNLHWEPLVFVDMLYIPPNDTHEITVESFGSSDSLVSVQTVADSINIYTGRHRKVTSAPREGFDLMADNAGNVRLAYGDDTSTGAATFYYRKTGDALEWQDMHALFAHDDPAAEEIGPISFTPDNKQLYWSGRTPSSTVGLFTLDPETLKTTLLFGDPDNDVDQIIWSMDWQASQHPVAVTTMPGGPSLHLLDGNSLKVKYLKQLFGAFPGQMVKVLSNSSDASLMVVYVYSDRNPGDYYLFNAKTQHVDLLFNSMPDIDPQKMAAMKPVTFQAQDGVLLHGYLTLPPGSDGKHLPLIVNPHGGPHGIRDEWGWDPEVQFFANHGYAVLQVNYRGSGGYGMKFQDLGYQHWGTTMQSDLADAVRWVEKQGYADPKRVCIYGASYGGYAALENSVLYPDMYQCAVGYAGVYDLTLQAHHGDTHHYAGGRRYLDIVLGDDEEKLKAESPAYNVDKIKAHL
ncbi:MAG: alpha/beta hydrolase family protein, partial [Gammaproteobacteria bacterium]